MYITYSTSTNCIIHTADNLMDIIIFKIIKEKKHKLLVWTSNQSKKTFSTILQILTLYYQGSPTLGPMGHMWPRTQCVADFLFQDNILHISRWDRNKKLKIEIKIEGHFLHFLLAFTPHGRHSKEENFCGTLFLCDMFRSSKFILLRWTWTFIIQHYLNYTLSVLGVNDVGLMCFSRFLLFE